jgi:UDP-glucose 4-epimerase
MGFDPMMQFIHEEDLAEALALTVEQGLQGVFNVTGPGEVPLHTAIRETGGTAWPLPEFVLRPLFARLFALGMLPYPAGALDFLKYPITLCGDRFIDATGFQPSFSLEETLRSVRQ